MNLTSASAIDAISDRGFLVYRNRLVRPSARVLEPSSPYQYESMNRETKMKTNTNDHTAHAKVDAIASGAHEAVDWAAGATNNATDSLSDTGHEMKEMQEKWLAKAREYIQENPATSVGIAVAGGYFLSRILRSR